MLEFALKYAEIGWYVFPIKPRGKEPLTEHGFKDASINPNQIQLWWKQWPEANIARACGVSGIVVIDADQKNNGLANWEELRKELGIGHDTLVSFTGGGGQHWFYQAPEGIEIGNSNASFPLGIDIRGNGGYVVLPPSIHENGNFYRWELSSGPEDSPIQPLPEKLLNLIQSKKKTSGLCAMDSGMIHEGERNEKLYRYACSLRGRGLDEQVINILLDHENQTKCHPPLGESEVCKIAKSASKYAPNHTPDVVDQANLHCSDTGNAKRLVKKYGDKIKYCKTNNNWFIWDDTRWRIDSTGEIDRLAKKTAISIHQEAGEEPDSEQRRNLSKHALKTESAQSIRAMIEMARTEEGVSVKIEELDTNPMLLNCKNGTIDLKKGALMPHRKEQLITKLINSEYDPEAKCPKFEKFIYEVCGGNLELGAYLKRAIGYSLTGETSEQCMFILHGSGANGKTTLVEVILSLFNDYALKTQAETLMKKKSDAIRNDIARLWEARFVAASESEEGHRLAEAKIKELTGGDTNTARFLFKEDFNFIPKLKIWLSTNHKPHIRGTENAIWRRIKLIPFDVTFPPDKQNKRLKEELLAESPGILAWAVEGCLEWQREGLGEPPAVVNAVSTYREESDTVGRFIGECCTTDSSNKTAANQLYKAYQDWCDDNGESPVNQNSFGRTLGDKKLQRIKAKTGDRLTYYVGIKLETKEPELEPIGTN